MKIKLGKTVEGASLRERALEILAIKLLAAITDLSVDTMDMHRTLDRARLFLLRRVAARRYLRERERMKREEGRAA